MGRRTTLHWQKIIFSSQEQLNLRRVKSVGKRPFSLANVYCQHHLSLLGRFPPGLQRYHHGQSSLSFWLYGCGVVSFNKTLCASVFGKAPATGDKGLSPHLPENSFHRYKRKQGVTWSDLRMSPQHEVILGLLPPLCRHLTQLGWNTDDQVKNQTVRTKPWGAEHLSCLRTCI